MLKTTVCTPFGTFEFLRVPFRLSGASQTFQRLMNKVLEGMPFVFAYIDDLLVASDNMQDHMVHLAKSQLKVLCPHDEFDRSICGDNTYVRQSHICCLQSLSGRWVNVTD